MEECGDIFSLRFLGIGEWIFLCSPELVKELFKAPSDILDAGPVHRSLLGNMLGLDATFTLDGDAHRKRQRIVSPLLNGARIYKYIPIIREITEKTVAAWPHGRSFSLLPYTHRISLGVLTRAMFSRCPEPTIQEYLELFDSFAKSGPRSPLARMPFLHFNLGPLSPWGRFLRQRAATRGAYLQEINRRRNGSPCREEDDDILDALLQAEEDDGSRLSDEAVIDEVINLLFAGHETTGTALSWIIERILSNPEVRDRLESELDSVLGGGSIERQHLAQLKYLNAVIHESHRYRAIAPMAAVRTAKQPFEIGGYSIPAGRVVVECLYLIGNRAEIFPNPHLFNPDRFLETTPNRYEWTPFGGGKRVCAGRGLAQLELQCITATIFQKARLRLCQQDTGVKLGGHMLVPEQGLRVILET